MPRVPFGSFRHLGFAHEPLRGAGFLAQVGLLLGAGPETTCSIAMVMIARGYFRSRPDDYRAQGPLARNPVDSSARELTLIAGIDPTHQLLDLLTDNPPVLLGF